MLNPKHLRMVEEIEKALTPDRLHWIEREWVQSIKRKFSEDNDPGLKTIGMLEMIWQKATNPNYRLPWQ